MARKAQAKSVGTSAAEPIVTVMVPKSPAELVRIQAAGLLALAERLDGSMAGAFEQAVQRIAGGKGRVVVTGMGKSGQIAQKIASTFSSTGTPAMFLHPGEAAHGDLGMLSRGDVVIALSASGETEEVLRLLPTLQRVGDGLISFCCSLQSTLARAADVVLDCSVPEEACGLGVAPTASTTAMLALGDTLAVAVSLRKGFRLEDFADLHPGGKLGSRLARVGSLMHTGDRVPIVAPTTPIAEVVYEMSRKKLGVTTVAVDGKLVGLISDGDLRRMLEWAGPDAFLMTAEGAMHTHPKTIAADRLAEAALQMMEDLKITSLVVVDRKGQIEGLLHLHDVLAIQPSAVGARPSSKARSRRGKTVRWRQS